MNLEHNGEPEKATSRRILVKCHLFKLKKNQTNPVNAAYRLAFRNIAAWHSEELEALWGEKGLPWRKVHRAPEQGKRPLISYTDGTLSGQHISPYIFLCLKYCVINLKNSCLFYR